LAFSSESEPEVPLSEVTVRKRRALHLTIASSVLRCTRRRRTGGREADNCAPYLQAVVGASWSVEVRASQIGFLPTHTAPNV